MRQQRFSTGNFCILVGYGCDTYTKGEKRRDCPFFSCEIGVFLRVSAMVVDIFPEILV